MYEGASGGSIASKIYTVDVRFPRVMHRGSVMGGEMRKVQLKAEFSECCDLMQCKKIYDDQLWFLYHIRDEKNIPQAI
jgi:hypothetical protein